MSNIAKIKPSLPFKSLFFASRFIFFNVFILTLLWVNIVQLPAIALTNDTEQALSTEPMSYQENSLTLNSEELKRPLYLKIESSTNTQMSGEIFLEIADNYEEGDRAISNLKNNLSINLSSLLQPGKNTISIVGNYKPQTAAVTVKLQGKNTQSTTVTQGSGILQQKLIIHVLPD